MMVGMEKLKHTRTKSPSRRLNELDRISHLPDHLVCHILSHLPTNYAVMTSVLSTRWRTLWLWVPNLVLAHWDIPYFNAFKSFGDRFFDSSRVSCIHRLKLITDNVYRSDTYLNSWIDAAVKRKIQHLYVFCSSPDTDYEMPRSLYSCETLVSLKLFEVKVTLDDLKFVSLPCVKTMHLKYVHYGMKATFERLVSCCPVLEELKVFSYGWVSHGAPVYRVLSRSLKKLRIKIEEDEKISGFGFVIDAPLLSFLRIKDNISESFIINHMDSISKVDISLLFGLDSFDEESVSSRRSTIRGFLLAISKVRDMTICKDTFELICQYLKSEPLPQFGYMSRLRVTAGVSDLKFLPTFLESCPNLKSLVLVLTNYVDEEMNQISFSSVPECLLSSLKSVDIESCTSGNVAHHVKLVRYLLKNSIILQKLTLRLSSCANENVIFKKLLKSNVKSTSVDW